MACPHDPTFECPTSPCFGGGDAARCSRLHARAARIRRGQGLVGESIDPAARDAVLACEHRGPEGGLPLLEDECHGCGGGAERTACAAMKGARPGRVTLRECLACKAQG